MSYYEEKTGEYRDRYLNKRIEVKSTELEYPVVTLVLSLNTKQIREALMVCFGLRVEKLN